MAAKKKKKDDGLKNFIITYTTQYSSSYKYYTQRAIDKHDAVLKFKQTNPGIKVKDATEEVIQPDPFEGRGLSTSSIHMDEAVPFKHYKYENNLIVDRSVQPPTIPAVMMIGVDLAKDEKTKQEGKIE